MLMEGKMNIFIEDEMDLLVIKIIYNAHSPPLSLKFIYIGKTLSRLY